jgi:DNA repair protein SbcC/Rad50
VRVHRLRITAFGPFAATVEVDLDALAAGGLFLLHGPTGAGKTSILDAVCFALYGVVPGSRQGARLRSDHAAEAVAPEVVCEFTASGRRFEVTRSPAWERPKKRGAGTTTEQARVLVRESVGGDWQPVTSRIDEAADLLDDVLGLGVDQFTKLVLLPQGEFAAFLRAGAEERRALLERLFGTDRFAAVQQWMRETQAGLRQEVEAAEARAATLVARAEQAAGMIGVSAPVPPEDGGAAAPGELMSALTTGASAALDAARQERVAAQERAQHAAAEHRAAVDLARLQVRHAELRTRAQALAERAPEQTRQLGRLAAARRAAGIAAWTGPLEEARTRSSAALARVDAAMVALAHAAGPRAAGSEDIEDGEDGEGGALEGLDDEALLARARADRELLGLLGAVEQEAIEAAELDRSAAAARRVLTAATADLEAAGGELASLAERQERLRAEAAASVADAARIDTARAALEQAQVVSRAAAEAARLRKLADALADRRADLRQRRDDAREHHLDVRERRLAGMAAELAARLSPGAPCPVCGGVEHPAPAAAATGAPDEAAERSAEAALAAAQQAFADGEAELARTRARLEAALAASNGASPDAARRSIEGARAELADAEAGADRAGRLQDALAEAALAAEDAAARLRAAAERRNVTATEFARLDERRQALRRRVDEAAAGYADVSVRRTHVARRVDGAEALLAARQELRAATQHLAEVTDAARGAAEEAGFTDLDDAVAAVLPLAGINRLEQDCQAYEQELAVVEANLVAPDLLEAATAPPAQPTVTAAALELAQGDDEAAANTLDRCRAAADALSSLEAELRRHLEATEPLHRRYRLHADLTRCLEGTGGDNALRMSLSSYVLAARLEQVAAAASERLQVMSGGRYSLEHCDEAERGRGRSGLSLRVVDGWTGRRRDTSSLSGGESFYTSLALALGLADVVTAEAGGARVETLFVDEGFGSLDEETLQEVLDTLDGLRSGGRVVGLVSHVPDMRDRIPARLEVVKTRWGSTVRQASA